jgi:hypothetical protein
LVDKNGYSSAAYSSSIVSPGSSLWNLNSDVVSKRPDQREFASEEGGVKKGVSEHKFARHNPEHLAVSFAFAAGS